MYFQALLQKSGTKLRGLFLRQSFTLRLHRSHAGERELPFEEKMRDCQTVLKLSLSFVELLESIEDQVGVTHSLNSYRKFRLRLLKLKTAVRDFHHMSKS